MIPIKFVAVGLLVAIAGAAPSVAGARIMEHWTYPSLLAKSDLVVIATPTKIDTTEEIAELPGISTQTPEGNRPVMGVGLQTTFHVAAYLKGKPAHGDTLVLHHYPVRSIPGVVVRSGPMLVQFDLSRHTEYLMFLVRERDGRYAATEGQTDPGDRAIRRLGNAY